MFLALAVSSRWAIEQVAGGSPSWNTGVDYARQLSMAAPSQQNAGRLYRRAGLDLRADLGRLAAEPRVAADPAAVVYLERASCPPEICGSRCSRSTGTGDQISTVAQRQSYGALVRRSGDESLLRQTYVQTAGHCTYTAGEQQVAIDRPRTGYWPDTSPGTLNRLASAADGTAGRYLSYAPPHFNRKHPAGR
ncbi:hypothetical protein [Amycolatopsis sp. NBC_00438]|uniref:hypothetical protein n=1 Tax=Amycolatopsis sp. NBC_00438 TaxID=2903558 RepID=UPI002E21CAA3